jgi:hypothetical protein
MNNWQPIASAPFNVDVLIYQPNVNKYSIERFHHEIICVARKEDRQSWWRPIGADGYECENQFEQDEITHWMPLPEPPK